MRYLCGLMLYVVSVNAFGSDPFFDAWTHVEKTESVESRPEVWLLVDPTGKCPPCDRAVADTVTPEFPLDVIVKKTIPRNVTISVYPTFMWQIKGLKSPTFHSGYSDRKTLLNAFEKSRSILPKSEPSVRYGKAWSPEEAPTPIEEVERVVKLLPKPQVGFVEFGCGSDARWCVAAVNRWQCKAIGIEIDPTRAALARERIRNDGLDEFITIIEGDATTIDVNGDVGSGYLYAETLAKLKPKLEKLKSFASYMHQPPGLPVTKNGDSWIYSKSVKVSSPVAVWGGQTYLGPICNSPRCGMCASIRQQLGVSQ